MRRVYQRHTDLSEPHKGDCFAACVATVLGLTLDEVPNFCSSSGDWWAELQAWLCDRGLQAIEIQIPFEEIIREGRKLPIGRLVVDTPVILSGKSPRGDWNHSIVGLYDEQPTDTPGEFKAGFVYYHDPNPDAGEDPTKWLVGMPIQILVFGLANPKRGYRLLNPKKETCQQSSS